jgi:hypothetical protein
LHIGRQGFIAARQESPGAAVCMSQEVPLWDHGDGVRRHFFTEVCGVPDVLALMAAPIAAMGVSATFISERGHHEEAFPVQGSQARWTFWPGVNLRAQQVARARIGHLVVRAPVDSEGMSLGFGPPEHLCVEHVWGSEQRPRADGSCVFIGHGGDGVTHTCVVAANGTILDPHGQVRWETAFADGTHQARVMECVQSARILPSLVDVYLADAAAQGLRVDRPDPRGIIGGLFGGGASQNNPVLEMWVDCVAFVAAELVKLGGVTSIVVGGDVLSWALRNDKLPSLLERLKAHGLPVWATVNPAALYGTLSHARAKRLNR